MFVFYAGRDLRNSSKQTVASNVRKKSSKFVISHVSFFIDGDPYANYPRKHVVRIA
jgi:hypothetical protein